MAVAFAHYTRFIDVNGNYINGRNYQNFFVGETRNYQSISYGFAPFAIIGLTSGRNGDVGEASLVSVPNGITVPLFAEMILDNWMIEVRTVAIKIAEGEAFTESADIALEVWACTGGTADVEKITVTLSSPLNAAMKEIPNRVLTKSMVGAIPPTGQITIY
jgi:hypothetical protein